MILLRESFSIDEKQYDYVLTVKGDLSFDIVTPTGLIRGWISPDGVHWERESFMDPNIQREELEQWIWDKVTENGLLVSESQMDALAYELRERLEEYVQSVCDDNAKDMLATFTKFVQDSYKRDPTAEEVRKAMRLYEDETAVLHAVSVYIERSLEKLGL